MGMVDSPVNSFFSRLGENRAPGKLGRRTLKD
jgi:hypothetical protein